MTTYADSVTTLLSNGYLPLPIVPHEKRPAIGDWTADSYEAPVGGFGGYGIGIACGRGEFPVVGIDVDVVDEALADEFTQFVLSTLGETIYRIGKAPKTMLIYRYESAGLRKQASHKYGAGRVEILGQGQQFVAFGIHPDTRKAYSWPGILGSVLDLSAHQLPIIDAAAIQRILAAFERMARARGLEPVGSEPTTIDTEIDPILDIPERLGLTLEYADRVLKNQDPDIVYEDWIRIGMALHFEFKGSPEAFDLWNDWSSTGTKYPGAEPLQKHWDSFDRGYQGRLISGAYLKGLDADRREADPWKHEDFFKSLDWSPSRFVDNPPPVPMIIQNFLPRGGVSIMYSAGGAGKSTLILSMALRIALGVDYNMNFLGNSLQGGRVVIITAEDPELILNHRYIGIVRAIAQELQVSIDVLRESADKMLSVVSTFGTPISLFKLQRDGDLAPTAHYTSLVECLAEMQGLQLVVIDTKSRFSPGESEGNVTITKEITYYEAIARRTGAGVMLLHHTNKASRNGSQDGLQAFRGESALFDSIRSAWYLRGLRDDELKDQDIPCSEGKNYLLLENSKNNYLQAHDPLILRREGYAYSVLAMKKKATSTERREMKLENDVKHIIAILQTAQGVKWTKKELRPLLEGIAWSRQNRAIDEAVEMGLLEELPINRKVSEYMLTDEGRAFGLSLED